MALPENRITPSNSFNPDLDWSQVRETLRMLNLAVAQIASALTEGDDSVTALGDAFTSMAGNAEVILLAAGELPPSTARTTVTDKCRAISGQMRETIIAFQFYDKLTQRLTHVANSLKALGDLVADRDQLYNPYAWRGMQEKIKSKYTVEAERVMFEELLKGATVEEALERCRAIQARAKRDDVELF
jgi:hypothetical protein